MGSCDWSMSISRPAFVVMQKKYLLTSSLKGTFYATIKAKNELRMLMELATFICRHEGKHSFEERFERNISCDYQG